MFPFTGWTLSPSKRDFRSTLCLQDARTQRGRLLDGGRQGGILFGCPDGLSGGERVPSRVGTQHVSLEVTGAGVGGGAHGALLGFLPRMLQRVVFQVRDDFERCAAVGTHIRTFTCNDTYIQICCCGSKENDYDDDDRDHEHRS